MKNSHEPFGRRSAIAKAKVYGERSSLRETGEMMCVTDCLETQKRYAELRHRSLSSAWKEKRKKASAAVGATDAVLRRQSVPALLARLPGIVP